MKYKSVNKVIPVEFPSASMTGPGGSEVEKMFPPAAGNIGHNKTRF